MPSDVIQLAGWVGLLLFGMLAMTDGLRSLAGDAVNRVLFRFTRSPWSGAATGAVATAVVQSSTVVTVATVGFVGAGLLSFPQALGIIWGANLGTTMRGWLVALVGFKLSTETAMLALVFVGALLRMFGRGRWKEIGRALTGFALIFVAIEQMRVAMEPFQDVVTPASLPGQSIGGRMLLVLVGIAVTLVTQSSSAGVVMALTALNAGTIAFPQAAAMVIGMDIGTTATSALVSFGGSPETKRTGFSHVVFNLFTGTAAFVALPLYATAVDAWFGDLARTHPEIALVAFHTIFNLLGVLAVLPFTHAFAAMMTRLFPDTAPSLTRRLDPVLARDAAASTLAVLLTAQDVAVALFCHLECLLRRGAEAPDVGLDEIQRAVDETRRYAGDSWSATAATASTEAPRQAALHCLDHLERLTGRCRQKRRRATALADPTLAPFAAQLAGELAAVADRLAAHDPAASAAPLQALRDEQQAAEPGFRRRTLDAVGPDMSFDEATAKLDAARWLRRVTYHAWRIAHHLLPLAAQRTEAKPAGG